MLPRSEDLFRYWLMFLAWSSDPKCDRLWLLLCWPRWLDFCFLLVLSLALLLLIFPSRLLHFSLELPEFRRPVGGIRPCFRSCCRLACDVVRDWLALGSVSVPCRWFETLRLMSLNRDNMLAVVRSCVLFLDKTFFGDPNFEFLEPFTEVFMYLEWTPEICVCDGL